MNRKQQTKIRIGSGAAFGRDRIDQAAIVAEEGNVIMLQGHLVGF